MKKYNCFYLSITAIFFHIFTIQQSYSQPEKFGHINYTVPSGWNEVKYQNGVRLTIAPAKKELISIDIMQPLNFSGALEQAFEKSYNETCDVLQVTKMRESNGNNYSTKEPKKSFKGWEYIRGSGGIQVNNGTPYPDEYGLELFVIKINNRFERIAIVKSNNTCGRFSRYYPSDRLKYSDAIENFLFSLKFDDWKEPGLANGTLNGNVFTGAWQGFSMSVGLSKPGAALDVKQLILFSNGQAYFGKYFPVEGLDEINTLIKAENNRRDWGYYSFNSGRGLLKLPFGEIPIRVENDKLILTTNKTEHSFIKRNSIDGAKFNGTYSMSEAYGRLNDAVGQGIIPSITFTSDGKFMDKGAVRILYHENTECINEAIPYGSGTYEAKNHSLIFNYTDGRKIKIAFPGIDFDKSNNSPSSIKLSFNQDVLWRQ